MMLFIMCVGVGMYILREQKRTRCYSCYTFPQHPRSESSTCISEVSLALLPPKLDVTLSVSVGAIQCSRLNETKR